MCRTKTGAWYMNYRGHKRNRYLRGSTREIALQDVQHAMALAISVLHELNCTMSQIKMLEPAEQGRKVRIPSNCLVLNGAVEQAAVSCRNIPGVIIDQV